MDFKLKMKNAMNTMVRNIHAKVQGNSEFETRLCKATFPFDQEEPKEKHVIFIIQCFEGRHSDLISCDDALSLFLEHHQKNINEFISNLKSFIIIHRALQSLKAAPDVCDWISELERKDQTEFQNKNDQWIKSYIPKQLKNGVIANSAEEMFKIEISSVYSQYVKKRGLIQKKISFLNLAKFEGQKQYQNLNSDQLINMFTQINNLVDQIRDLFSRLYIDKEPLSIKEYEIKQFQNSINGPLMNLSATDIQYLRQIHWNDRIIRNIIQLTFRDHLDFYNYLHGIISQILQIAIGSQSIENLKNVSEICQVFQKQSEQIIKIISSMEQNFQITTSPEYPISKSFVLIEDEVDSIFKLLQNQSKKDILLVQNLFQKLFDKLNVKNIDDSQKQDNENIKINTNNKKNIFQSEKKCSIKDDDFFNFDFQNKETQSTEKKFKNEQTFKTAQPETSDLIDLDSQNNKQKNQNQDFFDFFDPKIANQKQPVQNHIFPQQFLSGQQLQYNGFYNGIGQMSTSQQSNLQIYASTTRITGRQLKQIQEEEILKQMWNQ